MSDLKPCPFCGAEVKIAPEGDYWEIVCDDCRLGMWGNTYENLEYKWNRRKV